MIGGGDVGKNTPFKDNNSIFDIFDVSNKPVLNGAKSVSKKTAFGTNYNLIVCSNVLEHVPYPADLILDIKNAMNKDTVLYIEVPYEDVIRVSDPDVDLSQLKRHWHEHINFYSENSLRNILSICGFEIIALRKLNASAGGNSAFIFQVACKFGPGP